MEAQSQVTSSIFPLIFSSPQISGDLSSDPVLKQPGRAGQKVRELTFHVTYKHPHSGLICALPMLAQLVALVCLALEPKEIFTLI